MGRQPPLRGGRNGEQKPRPVGGYELVEFGVEEDKAVLSLLSLS